MKQTAIEWLVEQLFKTNNNTNDAKKIDVKSIIQQAKEMEKQQQGYSEEDMEIIEISSIEANYIPHYQTKQGFISGAKWQQEQDKKCYHPLPYRLAKSDINFECTLCGKFI